MGLSKIIYYIQPFVFRILDWWASLVSMPRGYAILCYHRILSSDAAGHIPGFLGVDVDSFKHQMQFIKTQAQPISLMEMVERIQCGVQADGLFVAVTFDDGYADNLVTAYPILKDLNIPATIFVSTAYVDNPKIIPWWDELHDLIYYVSGPLGIEHEGREIYFDMNTSVGKRAAIAKLSNFLIHGKSLDQENILSLLRYNVLNYSQPVHNGYAGWDQLKRVASEGLIEVGGHTVTHPNLTQCVDWGSDEIAAGKKRLEDVLGMPVNLFSYPFGAFNHSTINAVRQTNFLGAVTSSLGINQSGDNIFCLKRIPVVFSKNENRFLTRLRIAASGLLSFLFNKLGNNLR
jgi:peptidoglycan/xylan/chitin deacetylase (PgdA/CDA1 family)